MNQKYPNVITRFLSQKERLILSRESEMPLVIEASNNNKSTEFLHQFLSSHSSQILEDVAKYGAILLRGFEIRSDEDFENTILSIPEFKGISEAFMSEYGRIHVGNLKFVLHTNSVYKTGGTVYLGGFHSENYYSADVPSYICFCCHKPSLLGGETGLINMSKIFESLDSSLKDRLAKNTFFVSKWLVSEVSKRYQIKVEMIEKICKEFNLPIVGEGDDQFILMYKPSIFENPKTKRQALQINLFELPTLNSAIRKCFINDYQGQQWFWHRFVWRLPKWIMSVLETTFLIAGAVFYSPKESFKMLKIKLNSYRSSLKYKMKFATFNTTKVGNIFSEQDVKDLAKLVRNYYSSCLWQAGDILIVDNKQVAHAGMPGSGKRLIRALICNPLNMQYQYSESGHLHCVDRNTESIGFYMANARDSDYLNNLLNNSPVRL